MSGPPLRRIAVVSGYFNPLHVGHLRLMEAARGLGGHLVVIVNNDDQQRAKIGRVHLPADERLRVVEALRVVDEAFVAVDDGPGVGASLASVRERHPDAAIVFCNGGDRRSDSDTPAEELAAARAAGIELAYGVGGDDKHDTSTRLRGG